MRTKPEHIRKQYAFGVSFAITAVIFTVWFTTFGARNASLSDSGMKTNPPLSALAGSMTAGVGDAFTYVKDLFTGGNKAEYVQDNVEVIAGKR